MYKKLELCGCVLMLQPIQLCGHLKLGQYHVYLFTVCIQVHVAVPYGDVRLRRGCEVGKLRLDGDVHHRPPQTTKGWLCGLFTRECKAYSSGQQPGQRL